MMLYNLNSIARVRWILFCSCANPLEVPLPATFFAITFHREGQPLQSSSCCSGLVSRTSERGFGVKGGLFALRHSKPCPKPKPGIGMMEESCSSKGQATSSPSPPPPPLRGTRSGAWPVIVLLLVVFASVCDAAATDSVRDADQAQAGYLDNHNMDPAIVQGATFGEYGGYAFSLAKGVSPLCLFFFL